MVDAGPLGPATVVILGLLSAVSFGASDFGGGLSSRSLPLLGVTLTVNAVGGTIALMLAVTTGEPPPGPDAIVLAAIAGMFGVVGLLALYRGLAVGRMGVVAPVIGVIGAAVPVSVGIVLEGAPPTQVAIGIVLALLAVIIVSRTPDSGGRRSGLEFALAGGLGIGLFSTFIGRLPEGSVWWPLVVLKLVAIIVIIGVALVGGRPYRFPRQMLPPTMAVGLGDMAGNTFFVLATQTGRLDIAAVLSSLYPVVTVVLAFVFLREHINRRHAIGIATAAAAVALIASGSSASA
jgi:drug/metabolite transporter (DMT)-like permease